jgi:hypothetical protein
MALVEVASLCEDGSLRKRSIVTNRDKLSAWSKLFIRKVTSGRPIRFGKVLRHLGVAF